MSSLPIPRLDQLGLPGDIVGIARANHDLPPVARKRVLEAIAQYDTELEGLKARSSALEWDPLDLIVLQEIQEVKWRRDICKGLIGALRKVPTEVLGDIFVMCLTPRLRCWETDEGHASWSERRTAQDEEEKREERTRKTFAGVLGLVSRSWRSVCLATPALWSEVVVKTGYFVAHEELCRTFPMRLGSLVRAAHLDGLMQRMDMLSSYSWSLRVNGKSLWRAESNPDSSPFGSIPLGQVLAGRPATSHLTQLSVDGIGKSKLGMQRLYLPQLKSVVIRCRMEWDEDNESLPYMPLLEKAVLHCALSIRRIPSPETVPWGNLTHLFLLPIDHRQWKAIIRLCSRLQKGMFKLHYWEEDDLPFHPSAAMEYQETSGEVVLDDLQELTFLAESPFSNEEVLVRDIVCPRLHKLDVFSNDGIDLWDFGAVHMYQNLTHLSLRIRTPRGIFPSGDTMVRILETVPRLETAFLTLGVEIEVLLDYLTYGAARYHSTDGFKMRYLKALGLELDLLAWAAGRRVEGLDDLFPYEDFHSFITSRTEAPLTGKDTPVPDSLAKLETLMIHINGLDKPIPKIAERLRDVVTPLARLYGLKAVVRSKLDKEEGSPSRHRLWRHWDDGLMEFVEREEAYGLHSK